MCVECVSNARPLLLEPVWPGLLVAVLAGRPSGRLHGPRPSGPRRFCRACRMLCLIARVQLHLVPSAKTTHSSTSILRKTNRLVWWPGGSLPLICSATVSARDACAADLRSHPLLSISKRDLPSVPHGLSRGIGCRDCCLDGRLGRALAVICGLPAAASTAVPAVVQRPR